MDLIWEHRRLCASLRRICCSRCQNKGLAVTAPVFISYLWGSSFRVRKKPPKAPIKPPTPIARTYGPINAIPDHRPIRCIPTLGPKKSTVVESSREIAIAAVEIVNGVKSHSAKSLKAEQNDSAQDAQEPSRNDENEWHRGRTIVPHVRGCLWSG
jgi:hypothetical protein